MPVSDAAGAVKTALRRGLAAAAAALLLFAMPVPYVLYEPGKVVPVGDLVTVGKTDRPDRTVPPDRQDAARQPGRPEGGQSDGQGEWLLTTVYLEPRTALWPVIASAWRTDREAHPRRSVFQGMSAEEYAARMDVLMEESQRKAMEAAFRAAGVPYEREPDGVYAVRSAGPLKAGDRILAVDGAPVRGLDELAEALSGRGGREAELTVRRGGREIAVRLAADEAGTDAAAGRLGGAELIGIFAIRPADSAVSVAIDDGGFAGPSAGLALALHLYERLTGEPLTGGRRIAATGTIEPSGAVGAVGGVKMKAIAASRAGAGLFLVPESSAAEAAAAAEAAGGGMAVAGVKSLEEAVSLLRALHVQEGRTMIGGS